MKRLIKVSPVGFIAIFIAGLLVACAMPSGVTTDPIAPDPTVAQGTPVPDVVGLDGSSAQSMLLDAGFLVEFDGDGVVLMPSNWSVVAQTPLADEIATPGTTISLSVEKPRPIAAPTEAAEEATVEGLTGTFAQAACDRHGATAFPFGWDPHWILGKLAEEVREHEWYFKITADVTNEFNAEQELNVECYVSGTNEAPVVTNFLAY